MMALANTTADGEPMAFDLPLLTRLLPGLVSAVALLPASLALEFRGAASALLPLLIVQAVLLALGAGALARTAHDQLSHWEARVAPLSARDRVRDGLWGKLWRLGAIGLAGPLALALVLGWRGDGWQALCSAFAVPTACLCGGLLAVASWHGRAPRLLLLPSLAVLAVILVAPAGSGSGREWAFAALAAIGVGLVWRWLASRQALAVVARPLPWPRPLAWWRKTAAYRGWQLTSGLEPGAPVPARNGSDRYRFVGLLLPLMWLPQFLGQSDRMRWLTWGHAYDDTYHAVMYGGCMLMLTVTAAGCYVAPPVHWRLRLSPRGITPQRWAVRMVLGSMAAAAALFSVALMLIVIFDASGSRYVNGASWLSLMGDVLVGSSFFHWVRGLHDGRRMSAWLAVPVVLAFAALPALLVYGLQWLGVSPQRGALWLTLQLVVAMPVTLAAVRVWSHRDLNQVS